MSAALAFPLAAADVGKEGLNFGDAIQFLFVPRESVTGGVQVGGVDEMLHLTANHMLLSGLAVGIACLLALPIGLWLGHADRGEFFAVSISNVGRAVPTLALIAFFIAFVGIGFANVLLALTLLAIPPLLTNTYVGVRGVDPDAVDAARGMGMSEAHIVRRVELPLATRTIFGGIQLAAISVVATAILGPLASVETLGTPIVSVNVYGQAGLLGAAILVAVLAVLVYALLTALQRACTPRGLKAGREPRGLLRRIPLLERRRAQPT
jgi:osmoprotectant transport system permease protein